MSRRTGIGYKALVSRASELMIAKLSWSKRSGVNPAVVWRGPVFLPGEISPHARKGDMDDVVSATCFTEREVSSGRISCDEQ